MRRSLTTTTAAAATVDSSSFAQRIRDLPKDLPGTNIKKHVSQVSYNSLTLSDFSFQQHTMQLCFIIAHADAVTQVSSPKFVFLFLFSVHSYHATCTARILLYPNFCCCCFSSRAVWMYLYGSIA